MHTRYIYIYGTRHIRIFCVFFFYFLLRFSFTFLFFRYRGEECSYCRIATAVAAGNQNGSKIQCIAWRHIWRRLSSVWVAAKVFVDERKLLGLERARIGLLCARVYPLRRFFFSWWSNATWWTVIVRTLCGVSTTAVVVSVAWFGYVVAWCEGIQCEPYGRSLVHFPVYKRRRQAPTAVEIKFSELKYWHATDGYDMPPEQVVSAGEKHTLMYLLIPGSCFLACKRIRPTIRPTWCQGLSSNVSFYPSTTINTYKSQNSSSVSRK